MKYLLGLAALCIAAVAYADEPLVPAPAGAALIAQLSAIGVQIYVCEAKDRGATWEFKSPDAKLFNSDGKEVGRHFAGPTWKNTDGSSVVGEVVAKATAPEAGAIPWLLLKAKSHDGNGAWASVVFIRRSATKGGVQPAGECDVAHVGQTVGVPYTATYELFTAPK